MTRITLIAGLAGLALAGTTRGDDAERLEVAVGQTAWRDVGIATGVRCDDLAIVAVELSTAAPTSNRFGVTGVREGTTRCRVGTVPGRPSFVFDIHVVRSPPRGSG